MKLIKHLTEVRENIPVPMTTELEVIAPFLKMAERDLIRLISREQFEKLVVAYDAATDDAVLKNAIDCAQRMAVNMGYYYAIPILSVNIGSSGIMITSNEHSKQAFKWQVDDVRKSLLELGFSAIEDLLESLEADPESFPEYHASEEFKKQKQYLISTASSFDENFKINGSRYIFHTISYIMKRVEQDVAYSFGSEFFKALKEDHAEGKKRELVDNFLKPGIARITAAKALKERVITLENGVASINLIGNFDNAKRDLVAEKEQTNAAFNQLTEDGSAFLEEGLAFILSYPADFPEYEVAVSRNKYKVKNDRARGVWMS